jgi:hypothetical protein
MAACMALRAFWYASCPAAKITDDTQKTIVSKNQVILTYVLSAARLP